jgi:hypothetical protein
VSVLQQLAPFCRNISHRSGPRLRFPRLQNAYHCRPVPIALEDTAAIAGNTHYPRRAAKPAHAACQAASRGYFRRRPMTVDADADGQPGQERDRQHRRCHPAGGLTGAATGGGTCRDRPAA